MEPCIFLLQPCFIYTEGTRNPLSLDKTGTKQQGTVSLFTTLRQHLVPKSFSLCSLIPMFSFSQCQLFFPPHKPDVAEVLFIFTVIKCLLGNLESKLCSEQQKECNVISCKSVPTAPVSISTQEPKQHRQ